MNTATSGTAGIPEVLREFIRPDEDDDTSIRLPAPARDGGRRIGMLIIPNIHYQAWKTRFPQGMEKGPQSRYLQSRRVFFAIDDLPADAPTSLVNGEESVFFSGYPSSIQAGKWIGNPPAELPVISYADITRLLGTPAPKSPPADPPQAPDYSVYLSTDAAKSPLHGIYAVYPLRLSKGDHTTGKMPCGVDGQTNSGVYNFTHTAEEVMRVFTSQARRKSVVASVRNFLVNKAKTKEDADYLRTVDITLCLGRVFSAEDGIMALDFDGYHPPEGINNGTGYHEVSSSGTGDHILIRTEKEMFPTGTNKIKRVIDGHEIELFYGKGNGMALTGYEATAGPIDLDTASEASKLITRMRADAGTPNKQKNITAGEGKDEPTGDITPPKKEEVEAAEEKYEALITTIIKEVASWQPKEGPMTATDDASSHLMFVCNLIAGRLRKGGFPVKDDGLTVAIMEKITRRSSVWTNYYTKNAKLGEHDPAKITRTVRNAIDFTTPKGQKVMVYEDDDDQDEQPEDTYDYEAEDAVIKSLMDRAPAPLLSSVAYYHAISPVPQPLFALTSTLIAASSVLARNWITARMVFDGAKLEPSTLNDYFMILAETGHGKDTVKTHLRNTVPEISQPAGVSGRTALHKSLQIHPRIKLLMDEAGKRIAEAGRDQSGIKQGGETLAMEIYGQTGCIDPQNFAQSKDSPVLRDIDRHGLVMLRTSTQDTLTEAVPLAAVNDGWLPRHIVVISKRPRPPTWGAYHPEGDDDPLTLLKDWDEWKIAHIGMPKYDTYRQAISPITAAVWGYRAPLAVIEAADEMQSPKTSYLTTKRVVNDPPITIKWEPEAAEAIAKIYEETEAVPKDNYTGMRHRKVAHIIKIAGIFALLSDGITKKGLIDIRKKHTGTDDGKKAIAEAADAKDAYDAARKELSELKKHGGEEAAVPAAEQKVNDTLKKWNEKRDIADNVVWKPCRAEITEQLQIVITADAVQWARDFYDLTEIQARKLVIEELIIAGFIAALDAVETFLTEHDGSASESRIIHGCKAVKALDGPHSGLNAFWDYCEKSGRIIPSSSNRGRRWSLPSAGESPQPEKAPMDPAGPDS